MMISRVKDLQSTMTNENHMHDTPVLIRVVLELRMLDD